MSARFLIAPMLTYSSFSIPASTLMSEIGVVMHSKNSMSGQASKGEISLMLVSDTIATCSFGK